MTLCPAIPAIPAGVPTPAPSWNDRVEALEAELLTAPRGPVEYRHHFAPGTYTREMIVPAGNLIIGHLHKTACTNVCLAGRAAVLIDGETRLIAAGAVFVAPPGHRKVAVVIEELRWLNIHPNPDDLRDLDALEQLFIDKSDSFQLHERHMKALASQLSTINHQPSPV